MRFILVILAVILNLNAKEIMRVKFSANGVNVSATLNDSDAAKALYERLPLKIELKSFGDSERISYLAQKLPIKNTPSNLKIKAGDIAYYAPWGNLAFFIKAYNGNDDLFLLGRFDGDFSEVLKADEIKIDKD